MGKPGAIPGLPHRETFLQEPTAPVSQRTGDGEATPGLAAVGGHCHCRDTEGAGVPPGGQEPREGCSAGSSTLCWKGSLLPHPPISCPRLNRAGSQWASWQWHLGNVVCRRRRSRKGPQISQGPAGLPHPPWEPQHPTQRVAQRRRFLNREGGQAGGGRAGGPRGALPARGAKPPARGLAPAGSRERLGACET